MDYNLDILDAATAVKSLTSNVMAIMDKITFGTDLHTEGIYTNDASCLTAGHLQPDYKGTRDEEYAYCKNRKLTREPSMVLQNREFGTRTNRKDGERKRYFKADTITYMDNDEDMIKAEAEMKLGVALTANSQMYRISKSKQLHETSNMTYKGTNTENIASASNTKQTNKGDKVLSPCYKADIEAAIPTSVAFPSDTEKAKSITESSPPTAETTPSPSETIPPITSIEVLKSDTVMVDRCPKTQVKGLKCNKFTECINSQRRKTEAANPTTISPERCVEIDADQTTFFKLKVSTNKSTVINAIEKAKRNIYSLFEKSNNEKSMPQVSVAHVSSPVSNKCNFAVDDKCQVSNSSQQSDFESIYEFEHDLKFLSTCNNMTSTPEKSANASVHTREPVSSKKIDSINEDSNTGRHSNEWEKPSSNVAITAKVVSVADNNVCKQTGCRQTLLDRIKQKTMQTTFSTVDDTFRSFCSSSGLIKQPEPPPLHTNTSDQHFIPPTLKGEGKNQNVFPSSYFGSSINLNTNSSTVFESGNILRLNPFMADDAVINPRLSSPYQHTIFRNPVRRCLSFSKSNTATSLPYKNTPILENIAESANGFKMAPPGVAPRFKNEDEEAVYYLITKYLDNKDMKW